MYFFGLDHRLHHAVEQSNLPRSSERCGSQRVPGNFFASFSYR